MNFNDITIISEGYNYIQDEDEKKIKVQKDESEYYHYTSPGNFCRIVKDGFIKGGTYSADTYTYEKPSKKNSPRDEICLARSDRNPERNNLSVSFGANETLAVKFTFKRDTIERVFGKIKPIDEYPTTAAKSINNIIRFAVMNNKNNPEAMKLIRDLNNNWRHWDYETAKQKQKQLLTVAKDDIKATMEDIAYYVLEYTERREKMESRIRTKGKPLPLKYVEHIYIPYALQFNPEVSKSIEALNEQHIPYSFVMPVKSLKNIDKSRIQYKS